jgi:hypothetical protein
MDQVIKFLALTKSRTRLQPTIELDETQLAALYAACAEEDRELAEEGMAEYTHGLGQEDVL